MHTISQVRLCDTRTEPWSHRYMTQMLDQLVSVQYTAPLHCDLFTHISLLIYSNLQFKVFISHRNDYSAMITVIAMPMVVVVWVGIQMHLLVKISTTTTTTTILRLSGPCPGQLRWAGTRRYIHPLTAITVINHPYLLSLSFMIHGILLVQFTCLAVFLHYICSSLLWSTTWPGTHHFISSPNHCLLFTAHAHTIATCFAVVLKLSGQLKMQD